MYIYVIRYTVTVVNDANVRDGTAAAITARQGSGFADDQRARAPRVDRASLIRFNLWSA